MPFSRLEPKPFFITLVFPTSLSFLSPNRGVVCNVLLTCCKDSVCRLWAETLLPGDSLLSGHHKNHTADHHSDAVGCAGTSLKNTCNEKMQGRTGQEVSYPNVIVAAKDTTPISKQSGTRVILYDIYLIEKV